MDYGICSLSMAPMRAMPSEQSEMVSQLLFGEMFSIEERQKEWCRICSHADGYNGWVSTNMIDVIGDDAFSQISENKRVVAKPLFMPGWNDNDGGQLVIPGGGIIYPDSMMFVGCSFEELERACDTGGKDVVTLAEAYLGAPYLWGGKTALGIDCSGFMQVVFRMKGVWLPRDTGEQAKQGVAVSFEECVRGDLAFFGHGDNRISHVALCCGNSEVIHSSGCVHKSRFDGYGIINSADSGYSHKLVCIKKVSI